MPEVQPAAPSVSPSPASPNGGGSKTLLIVIVVVVLALAAGGGYYFWSHRTKTIKTADGTTIKYTNTGKTETVTTENGDTAFGENVTLPSDFPKDIPIYSGAKFSSYTNTSDLPGYIATVNKSCSEVSAWYKAKYEKDGYRVVAEDATGFTVSNETYTGGMVITSNTGSTCEYSISRMAKQ